MKKKIITNTAYLIIFSFLMFFSNISFAFAQLQDSSDLEDQESAFLETSGFDSNFTIGAAVATAIKAFLGLLGIIFIFLMVLAGYHWMTAAGDEQKVTKAKDTIRTAVIGLIIIVAAYSITYFVLSALGKSTT